MAILEEAGPLKQLLTQARRIAVVGCSSNPERDSHQIARYLINAGYEVIPVNPVEKEILARKCYPDVKSIPGTVDIVDIFRKPDAVPLIVEDAIAAKAKSVWMQLGVGNPAAAQRASEAGLDVVVEKCIKVVHAVQGVGRKG